MTRSISSISSSCSIDGGSVGVVRIVVVVVLIVDGCNCQSHHNISQIKNRQHNISQQQHSLIPQCPIMDGITV